MNQDLHTQFQQALERRDYDGLARMLKRAGYGSPQSGVSPEEAVSALKEYIAWVEASPSQWVATEFVRTHIRGRWHITSPFEGNAFRRGPSLCGQPGYWSHHCDEDAVLKAAAQGNSCKACLRVLKSRFPFWKRRQFPRVHEGNA
jgi:hypothetical protein